jgi:hypothetical protein
MNQIFFNKIFKIHTRNSRHRSTDRIVLRPKGARALGTTELSLCLYKVFLYLRRYTAEQDQNQQVLFDPYAKKIVNFVFNVQYTKNSSIYLLFISIFEHLISRCKKFLE